MRRNAHHVERRDRRPSDEEAFVAQWQLEEVREFAVDESDEDGVVRGGFAVFVVIMAVAQDEPQGVGGLVPGAVFEV